MTEAQVIFIKNNLKKKYWNCKQLADIEDAVQYGLLQAVQYNIDKVAYALKAAKNYLFPQKAKRTITYERHGVRSEQKLREEILSEDRCIQINRVIIHEDLEHLHFSLSKISERSRTLLTDRYLNDMTVEQIAEKYGFEIDSVYGILSKARKELKGEYYAEN